MGAGGRVYTDRGRRQPQPTTREGDSWIKRNTRVAVRTAGMTASGQIWMRKARNSRTNVTKVAVPTWYVRHACCAWAGCLAVIDQGARSQSVANGRVGVPGSTHCWREGSHHFSLGGATSCVAWIFWEVREHPSADINAILVHRAKAVWRSV